MAINAYIFFCYILFLFLSLHASKPFVNGATVASSTCSGPARGLRIFHLYGPCSPTSKEKTPITYNSSQMFLQDERRVRGINSRGHSLNGKPAQPVGAGIYTVSVGFGTPVKNFNLILDTGSYITWVRCQNGYFNTSDSKTFSKKAQCGGSSCEYSQTYFDGSFVSGSLVLDTVTINSYEFSKFVFLCAESLSKEFSEGDAGILGLGQGGPGYDGGAYALISQTASKIGKVFCHCLPTIKTTGVLYFGTEALEECRNSGKYTSLDKSKLDHYHVNLNAITIGKLRLKIPSALPSSRGTIIDSGTTITRLPSSDYKLLQKAFQNLMSKYPRASPPRHSKMDTCYNLTAYSDLASIVPNMVLHFENNMDVDLDQEAVTWKGQNGLAQVCLAFADVNDLENENGLTIIGGHQLQKQNVLYNIQEGRVSIGRGNC